MRTGVGLSGNDVQLARQPGWNPNSFGYHGDDGNMFRASGSGTPYGPTFTKGVPLMLVAQLKSGDVL